MTSYKQKEEILNTTLNQVLVELQEDKLEIRLMLDDPTYQEHEKGVAYAIHEKIHHLVVHEMAVREIYKLLDDLRQEEIDKV